MTARTFRFYGKAFSQSGSVSVVARFGGIQVYSGPVPTTDSVSPDVVTEELDVLFEYVGSTDMVGAVPFELQATGGTIFFGMVRANYSGIEIAPNQPNSQNSIESVITPPENFWRPVSLVTAETDGKINVVVNNINQYRNLEQFPEVLGSWTYPILDNELLTCDILVDPNLIFIGIPE